MAAADGISSMPIPPAAIGIALTGKPVVGLTAAGLSEVMVNNRCAGCCRGCDRPVLALQPGRGDQAPGGIGHRGPAEAEIRGCCARSWPRRSDPSVARPWQRAGGARPPGPDPGRRMKAMRGASGIP